MATGSGTGTPASSSGGDYTTWAAVKTYLGITAAADDGLGATLVARATVEIERYCRGRRFVALTATRTFDVPVDDTLWLDDDLLTVTSVTNGDGTTVASTDYVLLPSNVYPKQMIRLRKASSVSWVGSSTTGDEQAISVAGTWGYSSTPPSDIVQAAVRLTAWLYKQRDGAFGQTARPEIGVIETPLAMPVDIERMLRPYRRWRMRAG